MSTYPFSCSADDGGESKPRSKRRTQKKSRHKGPDREDSEFRSRPPRKDMDDDDDDFDFDDEDVDDDIDPDFSDDDDFEDLDDDLDLEDDNY